MLYYDHEPYQCAKVVQIQLAAKCAQVVSLGLPLGLEAPVMTPNVGR